MQGGLDAGEEKTKEKITNNNFSLITWAKNKGFYDKKTKKGPLDIEVGVAIKVDVIQKKAEMFLASTTNSLIGSRKNISMDLIIESNEGKYIYTGLEDTGNYETDTYFSYYIDKKEMIVSYADVTISFIECTHISDL